MILLTAYFLNINWSLFFTSFAGLKKRKIRADSCIREDNVTEFTVYFIYRWKWIDYKLITVPFETPQNKGKSGCSRLKEELND